ncbi:MAG: O-antigen ligase [Venatoribacter sp.]
MIEKLHQLKKLALHLSIFSMGAFSLLTNSISVGPVIILVTSAIFFLNHFSIRLEQDDKKFISVLLLYFILGVFDTILRWQNISNMDLFVRYAVAAWFIYYLAQQQIQTWVLWSGYAIGAISVGIYAIYAKFYLHQVRVDTEALNAIRFGNYSLMLGFFCIAGIFWAKNLKWKRTSVVLMLLAAVGGILASLLSGTRSGWISYPMIFAMLILFFYDHVQKKYLILASLSGLILLATLVALPQTNVQNRIKEAVSDIEKYTQGNSSSSVGYRFDMWRSGYAAFLEKPIFGFGETAFRPFQEDRVKFDGLNPGILEHPHLHNQYIEELAMRGIIGLFIFLVFLIIPLRLFLKRIHNSDDNIRALALAGTLSIICMIDFCLTQAMLRVTSGVMFFVFNLVFIWALMRQEERKQEKTTYEEPSQLSLANSI